MPVTAARFETGRRPGFFSRRGLVDGSNGSISVHNSSPMIQDADLQHRRRAASAYPAGHNLSETWSLLIEVSVFARLFEQQNDPHRLHKIHATRCIDGEVSEIP